MNTDDNIIYQYTNTNTNTNTKLCDYLPYSSHRFPYDYHVTTSPQLLTISWILYLLIQTKINFYFILNLIILYKITNFHGVTGGMYKIWIHIHRNVIIYDY